LADGGRLVSLGVLSGSNVTVDLSQLLRRRQKVLGMAMRPRSLLEKIAVTQRFIRRGLPLFESGALRSIVDRVFEFEQVREAHAYMEQNSNLGKIALRVRGDAPITSP
jgi:NADPH:quinone reductase-like Zn-dependent oxidoreductase